MKKAVIPLLFLTLFLLCSCTPKMTKYPTREVAVYISATEREQTLNEGQKVGVEMNVSYAVKGIEITLPAQEQVSFLLYIYKADQPYADTVGKASPLFRKEVSVSAGQSRVTVYFNGPSAGLYYFVVEPKTAMKTVFCLPCDGAIGYLDGQASPTVPKITVLCE